MHTAIVAHPNKHIRQAIKYAEQHGWTFAKASAKAHIFGTLYCPQRTRDGHVRRVFSTPRSPDEHA